MRKKNTETIGDALKEFFEENTFFKRKLAESRIIKSWPKIMGTTLASYTSNIYLRNETLYVSLKSSVLRSELIMAKELLIKKLNEHAGMHVIDDIIFR